MQAERKEIELNLFGSDENVTVDKFKHISLFADLKKIQFEAESYFKDASDKSMSTNKFREDGVKAYRYQEALEELQILSKDGANLRPTNLLKSIDSFLKEYNIVYGNNGGGGGGGAPPSAASIKETVERQRKGRESRHGSTLVPK